MHTVSPFPSRRKLRHPGRPPRRPWRRLIGLAIFLSGVLLLLQSAFHALR